MISLNEGGHLLPRRFIDLVETIDKDEESPLLHKAVNQLPVRYLSV